MKNFFKYVLATFVGTTAGIIISAILVMILMAGVLGSMLSKQEKVVEIKSNTILVLEMDKPIVERKPDLPFDLGALQGKESMGLNEILESIEKAKEDDNIEGIHLKIGLLPTGISTIDEIRNALIDFKESGKFVTCYGEIYYQGSYYLATASDEIYFNPSGFFNFVGLRAKGVFLKNTLEKLEIEPQIFRHGKFKGATEMFDQEKWTDENREQLTTIIESFWESITSEISESRRISVEELNKMANEVLINDAQAAYKYNLVDSLIHKHELIAIMKEKMDVEEKDDLETVSLSDYKNVIVKKKKKSSSKNKIAVVYASGEIVSGSGDGQQIGSEKYGKAIRKARRDSSIKAIVLRVNSPGGSALASDVILAEVIEARKVKPVIVSMGDVAASGGYYISCAADQILVDETTLTGSIGVFTMFFNAGGLFDNMGITFDVATTNDNADFLSPNRGLSPVEIEYMNHQVDVIYDQFLNHVAKGRGMEKEEVHEIAQGRIWSGKDAVEIGLADGIGDLNDAIALASERAGLDDEYSIVELPEVEDPIQKLIKDLTAEAQMRIMVRKFGARAQYIEELQGILDQQGVMARIPYSLTIY